MQSFHCPRCQSVRPAEEFFPSTRMNGERCRSCRAAVWAEKQMRAPRPCMNCGSMVIAWREGKRTFCPGGECARSFRAKERLRLSELRICQICPEHLPLGRVKYCSDQCRQEAHVELTDSCSVDGCLRLVKTSSRMLCPMHDMRLRRTGEVGDADAVRVKRNNITPDGYRRMMVDGRTVLEHRVVMEQILGRYLWPDENVHHINGVRADNRPENLELWSTSQPPGQRVADKVEWAKELLCRYEPGSLIESHIKEIAS